MMVNIGIEKPNNKTKASTIGFVVLYLLIVLGFMSIGPKLFASTWVSSSDFHSCIEITSSFIAIIAAVACLMYYFGLKSRYYLLCGLGFFICGSEDFIHGLLSFTRLFSGIEADLSKFVPGTYVAGRSAFAIFIILAAVLGGRPRPSKSVRKETIFFSSIALIIAGGMTTLAIMLPLPRFIYPEQLISRPVDFVSAVLFAIAFVAVLKRYISRRSIFSGFLLACILLNLGGQVYMSFSKQLFDAFFDIAHWANILSYCMPVLGIAVQALKEIKNSKRELTARKQADEKLQKYSEHLEELVGERTTELESANSGLRHEITERKQMEAERERLLHDMKERIKELTCMYGVARLIREHEILEDLFREVIKIIPPGWQHPEFTRVKICFDGKEYTADSFEETEWKQTSDIVVKGERRGSVEIYYMDEFPLLDEGPFLKEERNLIDSIAQALSEAVERNRVEKELENEKNKIQKYIDVAEVILLVLDVNRKVLLINRRGCEILGHKEKEIIGKEWCDNFVPDLHRDKIQQVLSQLLTGEAEQPYYFEGSILTESNQSKLIAWHNTILYNEKGEIEGVLSSGEDITDRRHDEESLKSAYKELEKTNREIKEVQSQLVQNEKLASIGQLAAGVAHEMNNPVGFVASNFQTLENCVNKFKSIIDMYSNLIVQIETSEKAEIKKMVDDIKKSRDDMKIDFFLEEIQEIFDDSKEGLERITGVIQNLRDFSRVDQATDISEFELNDGIETTLVVAKNELKYNCDIKKEFSELPYIYCNSGQINQVILNILVNAAQAIKSQGRKDKGTVTIRTYATDTDVICEICDDGPGIPPDKISKIFDPFFTTKPVGKGTGLGLSVSYDIIVNKHKGKLFVDSTVGKGATFTIKLPTKWENQNEKKESETNVQENSVICG